MRISDRARKVRLVAKAEGVELVLPRGLAADDPRVAAFVAAKGPWIARARARIAARLSVMPGPQRYRDGETIQLRGATARLRLRAAGEGVAPAVAARPKGEAAEIEVALPARAENVGDEEREAAARAAVLAWLRTEALTDALRFAAPVLPRLGRRPADIRTFEARTRWGSCSPKGIVRVHWRLVQAPPAVFEYVLVHELCHLRELNHGPRFWAWMARLMPDVQERRAALKAWERGGEARRTM